MENNTIVEETGEKPIIFEDYGHSYVYETAHIQVYVNLQNYNIFNKETKNLIVITNYYVSHNNIPYYTASIIYEDCGDVNPYEVNPSPKWLVYQDSNCYIELFLKIINDISLEYYDANSPHYNHFDPNIEKIKFSEFKTNDDNKIFIDAIQNIANEMEIKYEDQISDDDK